MNFFIYLSWLEKGKYWHTPLSGRRAQEPLDNLVEGTFVLFKEDFNGTERAVLVGMLQEDLLSNNHNSYEVIESAARDSKYWERIHGRPVPLKDPSHSIVVGKGMYSVSRGNKEATLLADEKTDISLLEKVAAKAKSLIGITTTVDS